MLKHTVFMPLAQMNLGGSTSGPAATTGGAGPAVTGATVGTNPAGAASTTAPGSTTGPESQPKTPQQPPSFFDPTQIILIVVMFGALYFFLFRGPRKAEKARKALINELKKGDKVMTIGGLVARVVSIEGDEVVLKVDESNNTKATYRKSAIQDVLDRDDKK